MVELTSASRPLTSACMHHTHLLTTPQSFGNAIKHFKLEMLREAHASSLHAQISLLCHGGVQKQ